MDAPQVEAIVFFALVGVGMAALRQREGGIRVIRRPPDDGEADDEEGGSRQVF